MTFLQSPIFCCMLGPIAVQLAEIVDTSKIDSPQNPNYKSIKFYVSAVASIGIAAIVGFVCFNDERTYSRIVCFHTGISSLFLVRLLSSKLPAVVDARLKEYESNSIT